MIKVVASLSLLVRGKPGPKRSLVLQITRREIELSKRWCCGLCSCLCWRDLLLQLIHGFVVQGVRTPIVFVVRRARTTVSTVVRRRSGRRSASKEVTRRRIQILLCNDDSLQVAVRRSRNLAHSFRNSDHFSRRPKSQALIGAV